MASSERAAGGLGCTWRTTQQLKEAPRGAFYIWRGPRNYVMRLASDLGRGDIRFIGPDVARHHLLGKQGVVLIDHDIEWPELPEDLQAQILVMNSRWVQAQKLNDSPKE